jgi:hypothetical protein
MATNNNVMPARGHSTAPKFDATQPRELRRYFNELEMLFDTCDITDDQARKRHACRYVDIDSAELWESLPEFSPPATWTEFRIVVHKLYPGSEDDRKWSISDMDKLVGEQLRIGIFDANDLGLFYRSFYNITQFLRNKNRISEAEQSRAFVRGFQPPLWSRIARRLELKLPDHYPDDPYELSDIHEAAKFVLAGSTNSFTSTTSTSSTSPNRPSTLSPTESTSHIKVEDLTKILDRFATTIAAALANSNNHSNNSAPRINSTTRQDPSEPLLCIFCGLQGHFISECLTCQAYITDGKCKKNSEGKIVLPNGQFTPRSIPGRFIKDRIDEWRRRNPESTSTASPTLLYGIAPSPVSTPSPRGIYSVATLASKADERIANLEREILALRSGKPYARNDNSQSNIPASSTNAEIPRAAIPTDPITTPELSTDSQHPPSSTAKNNSAPASTPTSTTPAISPPAHPYATAKENSYLPPHERNFAGKHKEKDGPAYHTQAPVQKEKIAQDVFSRSMKTPVITLTSEELLSLSPEVRTRWREQVTSKRIQQDTNNSTNLFDETAIFLEDPYESYINSLGPGEIPKPFIVAKESHSIRSVMMNVEENPVESVVDPGSSIIAMSEDVCHELGLAYDPSIRLPMQSANGGIDLSLGMARNVPCALGSITLYMQIHVIRDPAYDILLGRPFDVLTESLVKNYRNEAQTLTIFDPNSTRSVTIPTIPRSNRRRKDFRK